MSSTTVRFVDTNVLLYASVGVEHEQAKVTKAAGILRATDLAISAQVLQEFYAQATRPTRRQRLSLADASHAVQSLSRLPVQPITVPLVRAAIAARERFQISYWDAAIIEAARMMGCELVLSEDLSDGRDYDGVRVENPFAGV